MPLAIELAAARVTVLSAEQIAARLGDRFTLLGPGDRTAPPRQRTLRATIDWSHDLLSAAEQILLRRLSVFSGWSLEMAEQVCADDRLPTEDVVGLLSGLVDKSLLVVEPEVLGQARYRMLDSIRAYAAQRLAEAGESAATQLRLRDYVLAVCERNEAVGMATIPSGWPAVVAVFRRYDVDVANLRQVLSSCLATGDAEAGLRICVAVRPSWIVRGSFGEGESWFARFLGLGREGVPDEVLGTALIGRAQLILPNDPARARSGRAPGWSCARPRACSSGRPPRRTCWPRPPCRPACRPSPRHGRPRPWPPPGRRVTPGTRGTRLARRPPWPRPRAGCARPSSSARPRSR